MKLRDLLDGKPAWQNENLEVRLKAVEKNRLQQDELATLLSTETEASVRVAAISLLTDDSVLKKLLQSDSAPAELTAAINRILENSSAEGFGSWLQQSATETQQLISAQYVDDLELKLIAAKELKTPAAFQTLLSHPLPSKVHQHCAASLNVKSDIEQCLKQYLDKDKSVVHICKEKLEDIQAKDEAATKYLQSTEFLITSLNHHAKSEYDEHYAPRFANLVQQWLNQIAAAPEHPKVTADLGNLQARWDSQAVECQQLITDIPARQKLAGDSAQALIQAIAQRKADIDQNFEATDGLGPWLNNQNHQWETLERQYLTEQEIAQWHSLAEPLENLLSLWNKWQQVKTRINKAHDKNSLSAAINDITFPESVVIPSEYSAAITRLTELEGEHLRYQRRQENIQKDLDQKLETLTAELEKGDLKAAGRLSKSIAKSIVKLDKAEKLEQNFHQLQNKLKELRDWQGFATAPKREELCVKMEALITEETIEPDARATLIKEYQSDWKALGPSDTPIEQQLWSRFRAAGDQAYAPCKAHFDALYQQRQDNLTKRYEVCDNLESILKETDWTEPDWKNVERQLKHQRNEWRKYEDIPRSQFRKVTGRFHKVMDELNKHLKSEQDRNQLKKQAMIDQLQLALDEEDSLPVGLAKKLQSDWKTVGLTDRRADQKLWKQFRRVCDHVFEKLKEEQQVQRDEIKQKDQQVDQLLENISKLANELTDPNLEDEEFTTLLADINRLRGEYTGSQVPDKHRSQQKLKGIDKQIRNIRQARAGQAKEKELLKLKEAGELCHQVEMNPSQRSALEAAWSAIKFSDNEFEKAINARWLRADSAPADDTSLQLAKDLVIRCEILAELESPSDQQNRRMEIQVEKLNKQLTQGQKETRSPAEQLRALQIDWYCNGPIASEQYDVLTSRFERAVMAAGGKASSNRH